MKLLFALTALCLTFCASGFGNSNGEEMEVKANPQTIAQIIHLFDKEKFYLMTDGSLWRAQDFSYPYQQGYTINIDNFNNPQPGQLYAWMDGYWNSSDDWVEIRRQARLIMNGGFGNSDPIPSDTCKENFEIISVVDDDNKEILILNGGTVVLLPSHHRGNAVGDQITIHIMKNGLSAYLERHLHTDGQTILIPMSRTSSHSFMAY